MSTNLGEFKCPNTDDGPFAVDDKEIHFTKFYGGDLRGTCVQITIGLKYVQLTSTEVSNLMMELAGIWKEMG